MHTSQFTLRMNATRIGEGPDAQIEGIVLDVTERKRAEDALRAREAQLRNLGNNLPDGVIVMGQLALIQKGRNVADSVERTRVAALRIRDIVLHMTRITRVERAADWSPALPPMLDLRRSGAGDDEPDHRPVDPSPS